MVNKKLAALENVLLTLSILPGISSMIYAIQGDDKWFSRVALASVMFGFYTIVECVSPKNRYDHIIRRRLIWKHLEEFLYH